MGSILFRLPIYITIALVIAFYGAVKSSLWALDATRGFGGLEVNGWSAYPDIQTAAADPYAKAHRANDGRLLLGRAEGLVFRADRDQDGELLRANCRYNVIGSVPPALFWTLRTIYLEETKQRTPLGLPTSLNAHQALKTQDGDISLALSSSAVTGNWIALTGDANFELQLTLIDTPTSNDSGIREFAMPSIIKEKC